MKDKLIIKNFSGIDYLEIELKKLNILIGAQASGKSTVAKLFYYFNLLLENINQCIIQDFFTNKSENIMTLEEKQTKRFWALFDNVSIHKSFEIKYFFSEDYFIHLLYDTSTEELEVNFSKELNQIINEITNKYKKQVQNLIIDNTNTFFTAQFLNTLIPSTQKDFLDKGIHLKMQIFIPAGRSYFSILQDNIFHLMNTEDTNIDYVLKKFGTMYEIVKKNINFQSFNQELFKTIIKAKYSVDDDGEFLTHTDGRKVSIAHASSGQQEALPILLIIQHILENKIKQNNGLLLYIEEPEAHLFPTAQKDLVHLFSRVFNHLESDDNHIFITTHSPYLLTSFNTLLTAGSIVCRQPEKAEQVYKVIPKEEILFSKEVGAYSLMNGELKSLIDQEEELILAEVLDEVSGKIADEFDKLLDLKYGN